MAHAHAAIKALRQTKKRTAKNVAVKKTVSYLRKQALKKVDVKDSTGAQDYLLKMTKAIDKAAQRNIISKNTAARRKSRLVKKIAALKAA